MEIVANQAACYYMEQKVDTALFLITWLKECQKNDETTEQLEHMINLKKLHFMNSRTPQQETDYQSAKRAVLAMSDENKAILYTEIEKWGMRDQAPMWIDKMDDNNPKKWYLKAIMATTYAKEDRPLIVTPSEDESDDKTFYRWPDEKLQQYQAEQWDDPKKAADLEQYQKDLIQYQKEHDGEMPPYPPTDYSEKKDQTPIDVNAFKDIPEYLAYFQHCFDMDDTKTYYHYYKEEKHVDEDLRKKFPYLKKNIELYRQMFKLLKRRDDAMSSVSQEENNEQATEPSEEGGEKPADETKDNETKNDETTKSE
jgi:hypothetical protein